MVVETIPKFIGFIYSLAMIFVLAYLWYSGQWRRKIGWLILVISTILGFLIFSPVAPYQFQQLVLRDVEGLGAPLVVGVIGLSVVLLLTFVFGRFFCGYLCPVGTIQEIAFHVPAPKSDLRLKIPLILIRAAVFLVFLLMAFIFSMSFLARFGIRDFFYLTLAPATAVFVLLLLLAVIFYRPFCRMICPYGVLLSLAAGKSICSLQRTDACIECKKCLTVCPTDEAKRDDRKAECYLCGRCKDVCPVAGALRYTRRQRTITSQGKKSER
jgi:polyferredoxin